MDLTSPGALCGVIGTAMSVELNDIVTGSLPSNIGSGLSFALAHQ